MATAEELKEILKLREEILQSIQNAVNLEPETRRNLREQLMALDANKVSLENIKDIQEQVNKRISESKKEIFGVRDAFAASVNELKKQNQGLVKSRKAFEGLESIAVKLSNDQAGISRMSKKELENVEQKVRIRQEELKSAINLLEAEAEILQKKEKQGTITPEEVKRQEDITNALKASRIEADKNAENSKILIDQAQERLDIENGIQKVLGVLPGLAKGLGNALQKIGLPDLGISKAVEDTEEFLRDNKESRTTFGALNKLSENLGKNLAENLSFSNLFQTALVASVTTLIELDKSSEDLARNMNMSYNETTAYRQELSISAGLSNDLFISSKGLAESSMAINNALGTSVKLNDENLKTFTKLRETSGLTNEELMGINKLTLGTNKNLEDATGEILAQAKITGLQNGVSLNQKDILKDIQNVSAATTLSFGKNPKLIAQAVAEAKSLGLNLQKIESITNNILDFESSIQSELEAELLTGKQLNLETARLAALNNDLATVASEVSKNIGDSAEFSKMNRLQQDALAKSVGLSRDDLAETLFIQDQLTGLSKEDAEEKQSILNARIQEVGLAQATRELQGKSLEDLKNQAGIATQFNAIVEKLKEGFVLVGTALMPVFNMISGIVGAFAEFPALIGAVVGGLAAMKVASGLIALRSLSIAVAEIFAGSFGSLGALGLPFAIAGVAALGAAVAGVSSMLADDMFSPPPGYGKRTLTGPEGSIALNNKDTVIAGTDLLGGNNTTNNQNATVDNTALISKVDKLIAVNERILAKSSVIEMNGNEVGQGIQQSERAIQ